MMVMAVRRRRREAEPPLSLAVHAIAGACIAAFVVAVGISVHAACASMLRVYAGAGRRRREPQAALALSRGMAGQMNAIPVAVSITVLALVIWFIGVASTLSARRSDQRSPLFRTAVLVGLGLLPARARRVAVVHRHDQSFTAMAGMPPEAKAAFIDSALEAARAQLTYHARISWFAIPTLAVVAVVLIVVRGATGPRRARGRPPVGRSMPLAISAVAVFLLVLRVRSHGGRKRAAVAAVVRLAVRHAGRATDARFRRPGCARARPGRRRLSRSD